MMRWIKMKNRLIIIALILLAITAFVTKQYIDNGAEHVFGKDSIKDHKAYMKDGKIGSLLILNEVLRTTGKPVSSSNFEIIL